MRETTIQKIAVAVGSLLLFSAAALLVFGVSHQTRVAQGHALTITPQPLMTPTPAAEASVATTPITPTEKPSAQKPSSGTKSPTTSRPRTPERETVTTAPRDSDDSEGEPSAKPDNSNNEYDGGEGATESNKAPQTGESKSRNEGESQEASQ